MFVAEDVSVFGRIVFRINEICVVAQSFCFCFVITFSLFLNDFVITL